MQKLEVLIEENAFGSVRPVEVVADAPVGALVPALVEELKLPQTDLFGKKLVYMLRHSAGGRILPEQSTLLASGVEPGTRLALDSYVLDGSVATLVQNSPASPAPEPALHSSVTLADGANFAPLNVRNTTANLPPLVAKQRKWPRRAFIIFGAAALGVGGTSLGYAAYRSYKNAALHTSFATPAAVVPQPTAPKPAKTPAKPKAAFPTMAQALFTFTKHQQIVRSVNWSPDGTMLASGSDDTHVYIWNPNGTVLHTIPHQGPVHTLAWAPDGQRIVTGSQNHVAFYSVQNAALLATLNHAATVNEVAWTPHNQMQVVSVGNDSRAIVWNTTNYQQQVVFQRHTTAALAVSWSGDGQNVASGTQGGSIRVWQANNAQEIHGAYFMNTQVRALAFAPSGGQLAAGGNDGAVRIWNGLTCQQQANQTLTNQCIDVPLTLKASNTAVRYLQWSPDARFLAVGCNDGKVTVWYPAQNQQKPILTIQQKAAVHSVAWSPQGDQLASASGNIVTLWKLM